MVEGWNLDTAGLYWNGVIILEDARDGYCGELRACTAKRMRAVYG
jgi:hypothetical protein